MSLGQDDADRLCYTVQRMWLDLYGWPMPGDWEKAWMDYSNVHGISAAFRSMAGSPEAQQRAANLRQRDNTVPSGQGIEASEPGGLDLTLTNYYANLGIILTAASVR